MPGAAGGASCGAGRACGASLAGCALAASAGAIGSCRQARGFLAGELVMSCRRASVGGAACGADGWWLVATTD